MDGPRYLTKSRFALALECPAKLYYTGKDEFPDKKAGDPFLEALAEGGFQVGELARRYFPGGIMIEESGYDAAVTRTNELLRREKVVLYEAAFRYHDLFIRTDILVKKGDSLELIEVKAKSFDGRDASGFLNAGGFLEKSWRPYIYDVAFQKFVLSRALTGYEVQAFIMLADKNAVAGVDGLNQRFLIARDRHNRPVIRVVGDVDPASLGPPILIGVNVDEIIARIFCGTDSDMQPPVSFEGTVALWAEAYANDLKIGAPLGSKCKACEFYCTPSECLEGKRDGVRECWTEKAHFTGDDFLRPSILELWDFRNKDDYIRQGKYFLSDLTRQDIGAGRPSYRGMSRTERQWIQIAKAVKKDPTMELRKDELKAEMASWTYPLHFIDFETSAVAIPFHRNMRPYEGIAFQFSHHMAGEDGHIWHAGQFLHSQRGTFPNFTFVRELRRQLGNDRGTIFRYSHHENTFLNIIHDQLQRSSAQDVPDRDELIDWIKTISKSTGKQAASWEGDRAMVDLCELVKRCYYDPFTRGSNSIKDVLPAVLNRSAYLRQKYATAVYGTGQIPSLNFKEQVWIEYRDGSPVNPYDLLPSLFEGIPDEALAHFITDETLAEGGAAMMAYAKMQFSEMSDLERDHVIKGLLRYCELDTFAMVLIWEFWRDEVK
jgi:hypothetical protein